MDAQGIAVALYNKAPEKGSVSSRAAVVINKGSLPPHSQLHEETGEILLDIVATGTSRIPQVSKRLPDVKNVGRRLFRLFILCVISRFAFHTSIKLTFTQLHVRSQSGF